MKLKREQIVTIPTLVTFCDIYINNDKSKSKRENVDEFMSDINSQINVLFEVHYSQEESERIRIELCCKTFNIDISIYQKKEKLLPILERQIDKLLDEISNECGIRIKAKEVDISEYPQYYLNEEQLKKFNDFFKEEEQEEL